MRILCANHTGMCSGAEYAMLRLISGLQADHEVALACPAPGPLAAAAVRQGVDVLPIPEADLTFKLHPVLTTRGLSKTIAQGIGIRRAASDFRADVVHANTVRTGLATAASSWLPGAPVVVQVHEHLPRSLPGRTVRRAVAAGAQAVTGVSDWTTADFNWGLPEPCAVRVYISIDQERFDRDATQPAPLRAEFGLPDDSRLAGVVAQITPWKGQDTAIRGLAVARREDPRLHLFIVGDIVFKTDATRHDNQSYLRYLHTLVRDLELEDCVHFTGHRRDVPAMLAAMDVSLLPSWDEPFGTVVAESMAVGTPPLAGAVGGVAEYVQDGGNGWLLPPRQPEPWGRALASALSDPERLAEMGEQARRTARNFTNRRYMEGMLALYRKTIARGGGTATNGANGHHRAGLTVAS